MRENALNTYSLNIPKLSEAERNSCEGLYYRKGLLGSTQCNEER